MIEPEEFTLPEALFKTIDHFAPDFWTALAEVKDPRNPLLIGYPLHQELLVAVLMSMVKVDSRRNIKYKLGTPAFVANMQTILKRIYPKASPLTESDPVALTESEPPTEAGLPAAF